MWVTVNLLQFPSLLAGEWEYLFSPFMLKLSKSSKLTYDGSRNLNIGQQNLITSVTSQITLCGEKPWNIALYEKLWT